MEISAVYASADGSKPLLVRKHDVLIRGNGRTIADGVQLDNIRLLLEEYEQAAKNTRLIDEQGFHGSTDSANRLTVWSAY